MSLIQGGPTPVAIAAQETLPRPQELRDPVIVKQVPKGEAAARYQADQDSARRFNPGAGRGQRVDIDA